MTKRLKYLNQLPSYLLHADRYKAFRTAPVDFMLSHLRLRSWALEEGDLEEVSKVCKHNVFHKEPFYVPRFDDDDDDQEGEDYRLATITKKIHLLDQADVLRLSQTICPSHSNSDCESVNCPGNHITNYDVVEDGVIASLNLKSATDRELVEELAARLPYLRKLVNIPEPQLSLRSKHLLQKLQQGYLLRYIDLNIWAKINGLKISNGLYAIALDSSVYTAHKITNQIRQEADDALSKPFLNALESFAQTPL